MSLVMRFTARSHVGRVREGNEDSAYAGPRLIVLADGMGGHAAGEVASAAAVTSFLDLEDEEVADPAERLVRAVVSADLALREKIDEEPAREGMGTTLTALWWDGGALTLAHVGDSRAYRLRGGRLEQISHDHTYVQTLVDEGRLSPEQAATHPQRSLILRALDGRGRVEPDIERFEVEDGDRYLVCSDGLSDYVAYDDIVTGVRIADIDAAAERLVELALGNGAPDNVTVVLADIGDSDDTASLPPAAVDGAGRLGVLVGAVAEDEEERARAAAEANDSPDRRLHDPEDDSLPENQDEIARYAPREPSRWRWVRVGVVVLVVLGLLTGLGYAGWSWTRTQYYVGADDGSMVIYQGIDQRVVGQPLSEVYERTEVPLDQMPEVDRSRVVDSIDAQSLDDARLIAGRISDRAAACERFRDQADPGGSDGDEPTDDPDDEPTDEPTLEPSTTRGGAGGGGGGQTTTPGSDAVAGTTPPGGTADPSTSAGAGTTAAPSTTSTEVDTTTTSTTRPTTTRTTTAQSDDDTDDFDEPVTREECGVGS